MRVFFWGSIAYCGLALIVAITFMDGVEFTFGVIGGTADLFLGLVRFFIFVILLGVGILLLVVGHKTLSTRLIPVLYALVATIFMHSGYLVLKNSMPLIAGFYADPFLANVDRMLHFGVDPWVIAHQLAEKLPISWITFNYAAIWALPALGLPIIVAASDGNKNRVARTLILYVSAWVLIGNVLALLGLSVGPVYYDRLLGGDRFANLTAALKASGLTDSNVGRIQAYLWDIYTGKSSSIGSGISAFPSVHVAVATVAALYLAERSRWLIPVAVVFLLSILYYSVYCGFHYAIDGYVSITVMFSIWLVLRRKMPAQ